jgi:hypothetical protein
MQEKSAEGKTVFVSYANADDDLRKELDKHLSLLKKQHLIKIWHDQDISAGTEWEREIHAHLSTADIILLLISPDFMASKYCFSIEMERAMERHKRGEAQVIPIIVRPVDWQNAPFSKLQILPTGAKPIRSSKWQYLDEALLDVVEGIRKVIEASPGQKIQSHHPPFLQKSDQAPKEKEETHNLDVPSLPAIKTDIWRKLTNEEEGIVAAYDQALANEEYAGGRASLFQEKITFLKRLERYGEALAVCNQALAEELHAHDKLTLIKQKADFLKRLGPDENY